MSEKTQIITAVQMPGWISWSTAEDGISAIEETLMPVKMDASGDVFEYATGYSKINSNNEIVAEVVAIPGTVVWYSYDEYKLEDLVRVGLEQVKSSNINAIGYLPEERRLFVEFKNGGKYAYDNVLLNTYVQLQDAKSIGKYLSQHIKDTHPYEKVADNKYSFEYIVPATKEVDGGTDPVDAKDPDVQSVSGVTRDNVLPPDDFGEF